MAKKKDFSSDPTLSIEEEIASSKEGDLVMLPIPKDAERINDMIFVPRDKVIDIAIQLLLSARI